MKGVVVDRGVGAIVEGYGHGGSVGNVVCWKKKRLAITEGM